MHALIISHFIRKELQLTFYANETTSLLHGRLSRDGEYIIEFHPQYLDNPRRLRAQFKNQHIDLSTYRILLSAWASTESDQSASIRRKANH